ncbi:MAG: ZIP family metal transporter [Trueperaceae bacterium]|nr:ZIP family metal transporter [Trueperaceae bacterium]
MTGLEAWVVATFGEHPVLLGLLAGIVIATMNLVGALAIVPWRDPSARQLDGALGFAAGVMISASFTSLILPGIETGGLWPVVGGLALGVLALDRADAWVPHVHVLVTGRRRADAAEGGSGAVTSVILFIVAITLHNMPEGLAVGVGFGSGHVRDGLTLMTAIGLQNVPEGLAVAVAARNAGMGGLWYAAFVGARAGAVEIPLAVLGAWAVTFAAPLLPWAMGFAAGGMLYVISDEIIPETHGRGHERVATLGTMLGLVVMLVLDVTLA